MQNKTLRRLIRAPYSLHRWAEFDRSLQNQQARVAASIAMSSDHQVLYRLRGRLFRCSLLKPPQTREAQECRDVLRQGQCRDVASQWQFLVSTRQLSGGIQVSEFQSANHSRNAREGAARARFREGNRTTPALLPL